MKREIKFRAQAIHNGEWVYGLPIHYNRDPKREKWMMCDVDGLGIDIDEETLCQFTGLHDKNGNEIYEGDIVIVRDGTSIYARYYKGTVCFERGQWVVSYEKCGCEMRPRLFHDDFSDRKTTIIGNIHELPTKRRNMAFLKVKK